MAEQILVNVGTARKAALAYVIQANNGSENDALVSKLFNSIKPGTPYNKAGAQLFRSYSDFVKSGKNADANAAISAMAALYYTQKIQRAEVSAKGDDPEAVDFAVNVPDFTSFSRTALTKANQAFFTEERLRGFAKRKELAAQEEKRLADRTPQERALEEVVSSEARRAEVAQVLKRVYSGNINGALVKINNEIESAPLLGSQLGALHTAQRVLERQRYLQRNHESDFSVIPQANAAVPNNTSNLLPGTNIHYGDSISIAAQNARQNARLVVSSLYSERTQHRYFDPAQVKVYLNDIPVQARYSAADLAELHAKERVAREMGNQSEANVVQAVISTLTLENQFADIRKQGVNKFTVFATNADVGKFHRQALKKAGTYTATSGLGSVTTATGDDTAIATGGGAPETGASSGAVDASSPTVRTGSRQTPPPVPGAESLTVAQKQSIQFDMEALGLGTGQSGGFDASKGVEGMDGNFGRTTRPNLNKWLADDGFTELNADAIKKLHDAAEAKRAEDKGKGGGTAAPAAGASQTLPVDSAALTAESNPAPVDLKTQLADVLASVKGVSTDPIPLFQLLAMKSELDAAFRSSGLTAAKITEIANSGSIDYAKFEAKNDYIRGIEVALGLKADGQVDAQLVALLKDSKAGPVIAKAINAGSITAVAEATGAQVPSGAANSASVEFRSK